MIRFLCRELNNSDCAAGVAPGPHITYKTIDSVEKLEEWLREYDLDRYSYVTRECLGIEVIDSPEAPDA